MADGRALLLAAIRLEAEAEKIARLRGFSEEEWEALLEEAGRHGLVPLLFQALKAYYPDPQIPPQIQERMRSIYYNSAARNMRLYKQLEGLLNKFTTGKIPVIVLKGAYLAWTVYPNMALRPMVDVDLLVRYEDFTQVHRLLLEDGYSTAQDVLWPRQLPLYSRNGHMPIEIHSHLKSLPAADNVDIKSLWDRAEIIKIDKTEAYALCPEDLFLHLSLHACIQHNFENGLLACLDTAAFVNHYNGKLNWDTVWNRAEEWGIERAVYLMLAITEKLIGLPLPEEILQRMELNREAAEALDLAEHLMFEQLTALSPHLTPLFEQQGCRNKLKLIKQRIFISPEAGQNGQEDGLKRKSIKQYLSYISRLAVLISRHSKTIWLGLRGDPRTVADIENRNKKNRLKAWLAKTGE
jgi:hypothetical protein